MHSTNLTCWTGLTSEHRSPDFYPECDDQTGCGSAEPSYQHQQSTLSGRLLCTSQYGVMFVKFLIFLQIIVSSIKMYRILNFTDLTF